MTSYNKSSKSHDISSYNDQFYVRNLYMSFVAKCNNSQFRTIVKWSMTENLKVFVSIAEVLKLHLMAGTVRKNVL